MIAGNWFVTPHAVSRWQQYEMGGSTYEEALADLVRLSRVARPVREIRPGVWLYRGPKRRVNGRRVSGDRFVVSGRLGGAPQLVTVLPRRGEEESWSR